MVNRPTEQEGLLSEERSEIVRVRRYRGRRAFMIVGVGLLILLLVALAALWIARRPIATEFLEREFERRGVEASYKLDRVGFRTQQVSNLVIGDPRRPDLVARYAQIQMRLKWNGSFEVYRIVARGIGAAKRRLQG